MQHQTSTDQACLPGNVWTDPAIVQAARERHMGRLLRAYRKAHTPPLRQLELADRLGIDQGNLSRYERSTEPITRLDILERWARCLGIPQHLLWFRLPDETTAGDAPTARSQPHRLASASTNRSAVAEAVTAAEVRRMTASFRAADNRFGGSHSRAAIADYFSRSVEPALTTAKPDLLAAAAEMQHVAGWMAYDIGQPDLGRTHLRKAIRLCNDAGDSSLAAEMFAALSHQAAFSGAADTALDMALAAGQTAGRNGIPALASEIHVLEAHGQALRRDQRECLAALRNSERALDRATDDRPQWLAYFDHSYMAAKAAHVFRDLGAPLEAERYARRSLEMSDGYERGRLFNIALLASTLADQRRVEEACLEGARAVGMINRVRSVRATNYLSDLARRLAPFSATPQVRALYRDMDDVGIATPPV